MSKKTRTPWWTGEYMCWLESQVAIAFHCAEQPAVGSETIIPSLKLDNLNLFLQKRGFKLKSCNQKDLPHSPDQLETNDPEVSGENSDDVNDLRGKYLFPSPSGQGTFVVGFFHIEAGESSESMQDITSIKSMPGSAGTHSGGESPARRVVDIINYSLDRLRQEGKIPVVAAMPNWLVAATGCLGAEGYVTPPIPVPEEEFGASWKIALPELSATMQSWTGKDTTIFVLDTMPPHRQIKQASKDAGNANPLLQEVVAQMKAESIILNYQTLPRAVADDADDLLLTGMDLYGHDYGFSMPDHGLFVTGILHDLAPGASLEWFRVLNNFGIGDIHTLIHTFDQIRKRMATGDLANRPVVINLSSEFGPSPENLPHLWFADDGLFEPRDVAAVTRNLELLRTPFHMVIQSLTALGAVIVAASGNEMGGDHRQGPFYPAAFPEVISVGAVDKLGKAAAYSTYPASPPQHNGIATFGGGVPMPLPPMGDNGDIPAKTYGPADARTMTTAITTSGLRGLYSAARYPKLGAEDPDDEYLAPNKGAWAYWEGTSFAAPIISAVAARVLESMGQTSSLPSHLWASQVMWALTTAEGQAEILTGNAPLGLQADFTLDAGVPVGLLKAYQGEAKKAVK